MKQRLQPVGESRFVYLEELNRFNFELYNLLETSQAKTNRSGKVIPVSQSLYKDWLTSKKSSALALREQVVNFIRSGGSKYQAARHFKLNRSTIYRYLERFQSSREVTGNAVPSFRILQERIVRPASGRSHFH